MHSLPPPCKTQTIGELFTTEKADELFGKVITSVNIESSMLKDIVDKTGNVLMFGIFDGELVITGDNRRVLHSENYQLKEKDVQHVWTTDIILELLENGQQDVSIIEKRKEVMSITNGTQTLENGAWCPPYCSNNFSSR